MERLTKKSAVKKVVSQNTSNKTLREKVTQYSLAVSQIIIVAQTILLPIIFLPFTVLSLSATKLSFLYVATLLAFIAYMVHVLFKDEKKIVIPFDILSCSLYAIVVTYSIAAAGSTNSFISVWGRDFAIDSVLSVAVFLVYGLLVSIHVVNNKDVVLRIILGVVIVSLLAALLEIATVVFGVTVGNFFADGTKSTIGAWSDFGYFAVLMIAVLLFCVTQLKLITKIKWFMWITLSLYILFLCISGNILAWILLLCATLAIAIFQFFTKRTVLITALVVAVVSLLAVLFSSVINQTLINYIGISVEQSVTINSSLKVAQETLKTNPMWGIGPARFESQLPLFFNEVLLAESYWQVDFRYAASYMLTLPVSVGVIGTVPWLVLPIGLLFLFISFYVKGMYLQTYEHRIFFVTTLLALLLFVVMCLQTPSVTIIAYLVLCMGIVFGIAYRLELVPYKQIVFSKKYTSFISSVFIVVLITIAASLLVETVQKTRAELLYMQSQKNNTAGLFEDALVDIQHARALYATDVYALAENNILLIQFKNAVAEQVDNISSNSADMSVIEIIKTINDNFLSAVSFDKDNYHTYIEVANFYRLLVVLADPQIADQAYAEAKNNYRKALERKPDNPVVFVEIARLEEFRGDHAQVRIALEKALQLKPDYFEAMLYAVEFEQLHGTRSSALRLLRTFVADNPDDVVLRLLFAEAQVQVGNFDGAIASIRKLGTFGLVRDEMLIQITNSLASKTMKKRAREFLEETEEVFGESEVITKQLEILAQ